MDDSISGDSMGSLMSRHSSRESSNDNVISRIYKYPPISGSFFANYFIMGGEKFDTPHPETYLFGDNMDLNFLGMNPTPFPYPPPEATDPTRPIRCMIHLRRESLKLVRVTKDGKPSFNVEFVFDSDVRCSITIFYFCTEEVTNGCLSYVSRNTELTSESYYYKRGANQLFNQPTHFFDPTVHTDEQLQFDYRKEIYPVVVHCVALESIDDTQQSHSTVAVIDHHADGSYTLKTLKQKIFVDGLCYLLQEIYGIENKSTVQRKISDDEFDENSLDCVVCMTEMRDTLILPCRHSCLCRPCADALRYQASNCPICRSPFRALLHIKAVRKSNAAPTTPRSESSSDVLPIGYERISLVEALNGPTVMKRRSSGVSKEESPEVGFPRRHALSRDKHSKQSVGTHSRVKRCPCKQDIHSVLQTVSDREAPVRCEQDGNDTTQPSFELSIARLNGKSDVDIPSIEPEVRGNDIEVEELGLLPLSRLNFVNLDSRRNTISTDRACDINPGHYLTVTSEIKSEHSLSSEVDHEISASNDGNSNSSSLMIASQPLDFISSVIQSCKESSSRPTDDSDYYTPDDPPI